VSTSASELDPHSVPARSETRWRGCTWPERPSTGTSASPVRHRTVQRSAANDAFLPRRWARWVDLAFARVLRACECFSRSNRGARSTASRKKGPVATGFRSAIQGRGARGSSARFVAAIDDGFRSAIQGRGARGSGPQKLLGPQSNWRAPETPLAPVNRLCGGLATHLLALYQDGSSVIPQELPLFRPFM
jgi:hypothetical protein